MGPALGELEKRITADAENELTPYRFGHSVGVMNEAERIAVKAGIDPQKCRVAGILHDIAREYTAKQYAALGVRTGSDVRKGEGEVLLHGFAAAELGKIRYGIKDREILEAVRWHTTGRPGMGPVAQAVFVADYTEPGRTGPHHDRVREVFERYGLLSAVAEECRMTVQYRCGKNFLLPEAAEGEYPVPGSICVYSVETLNWAVAGLRKMRGITAPEEE